jgi:hypothetical protein
VQGSTEGSHRIGVSGIAKPADKDNPNKVANESICADLGRACLLPIPPGCVVAHEKTKTLHWVSLDFSAAGEVLPPADARGVAREFPRLACGVILFDLWIGNKDRHEGNISFDEDAKAIQIFDHGRALMRGSAGRKRLESLNDKELLDSNCLSAEIRELDGFDEWHDRIKAIPKFFIGEVVARAVEYGLPETEVDFCTNYLIRRRSQLMRIVKRHEKVFVNVMQKALPGLRSN